jgi:hypothetical protein
MPECRDTVAARSGEPIEVRVQRRDARELSASRVLAGDLERDAIELVSKCHERCLDARDGKTAYTTHHQRTAVVVVPNVNAIRPSS